MDAYRDMADVEDAFVEFMNMVPFYGAVTACIDNPALRAILPRVTPRVYTYGESPEADFRLRVLRASPGFHATFEVNTRGLILGPFHLHVPGRHNLLNATAAVAIGVQLGVAPAPLLRRPMTGILTLGAGNVVQAAPLLLECLAHESTRSLPGELCP